MFSKTAIELSAEITNAFSNREDGTFSTRHFYKIPSNGYVVGIGGIQINKYDKTLSEQITEFVQANIKEIDYLPNHYFGIWEDDSIVYVDKVRIIHEYAEAITLARQNSELAIYDLTNSECITV